MSTAPDLLGQLGSALAGRQWTRRELTFVLGTDEHIPHETRVALVPSHLTALREMFQGVGLELRLLAIANAGERAGFQDDAYREIGVEILDPHTLHDLERGSVDVFHALKEPTWYESQVPAPFLRIGALHLASYPPGVCSLLSSRRFSGIVDGGTVGNCSWRRYGGDRTPIVGSMSRFAGRAAGVKVIEGLEKNGVGAGKMVVIGAGVAGISAIRELRPKAEKLVVVESWAPTRERLPAQLGELGYMAEEVEIVDAVSDDALRDAVGIVFAHRSGAKAAEKVCDERQIRLMRRGAAISDIAIDQGGSIRHDHYSDLDDALTSRAKYQDLFRDDYFYFAETNMPRAMPHEASISHGDSSLPYVAALLALVALHGDAAAAAREILRCEKRDFVSVEELGERDALDCLTQDLRNGLQIACLDGKVSITDSDIEKHTALVDWVKTCAHTDDA